MMAASGEHCSTNYLQDKVERVNLDGTNRVYFCRLRAGSFVDSRKLVVTK